jgi:hypothetical protein
MDADPVFDYALRLECFLQFVGIDVQRYFLCAIALVATLVFRSFVLTLPYHQAEQLRRNEMIRKLLDSFAGVLQKPQYFKSPGISKAPVFQKPQYFIRLR